MKLIDRYIANVGRHLPQKSRTDIEKEIRSTLEDMLEDRSAQTNKPVDEEMTVQVLKEFGHPRKVAASYMPDRYLIGPQLYPYFIMVIKWALLVAFGVGLIRLSIGVIQAGPTVDAIVRSIVDSFLSMGGIAITALGNVTLIFAIIERALPDLKELSLDWDPRSLPEEAPTQSEAVNVPETVTEIVFTLIGVLIFNFYPQILGMGFMQNGEWVFIPLLSAAFFQYLPWINLLSGLEIVKGFVLLRQERWQPVTYWFSVVIDILQIGMLYAIATGPSVVGLTAANLQAAGIDDATGMLNLIHACVSFGLVVAMVVLSIQLVIKIYRVLSGNRKLSLLSIP